MRGPVRPRGRGLWRSVPAVRPPAGAAAAARATWRPRANASTGRNRTTGARRARRGGVCGSTVGVAGFFAATSTWSERRRHTVKGRVSRLRHASSPHASTDVFVCAVLCMHSALSHSTGGLQVSGRVTLF